MIVLALLFGMSAYYKRLKWSGLKTLKIAYKPPPEIFKEPMPQLKTEIIEKPKLPKE